MKSPGLPIRSFRNVRSCCADVIQVRDEAALLVVTKSY